MLTSPATRQAWLLPLIIVLAIGLAIGCFFEGKLLGYKSGYSVAYNSEHSHYLFEKRRGDVMQKRIAVQKTCVREFVRQIPTIQSGGLAAIGELMANVRAVIFGTVSCDRASDFGSITSDEYERITHTQ